MGRREILVAEGELHFNISVSEQDMTNLFTTSNESKTLEIENTDRTEHPFRLVVTLQKLGVTTKLDYFLTEEDARSMANTLTSAIG